MKQDEQAGKADTQPESEQALWWYERPGVVVKIVRALCVVCVVLLVIDPFVHKHGKFEIVHYWGFYGIYSFVSAGLLVIVASWMRALLSRPEDYYDR